MAQATACDGGSIALVLQCKGAAAGGGHLPGGGAWTAANAQTLEALVARALKERGRSISIDLTGVAEIDTFAFVLLERLARGLDGGRGQVRVIELSAKFRELGSFVHGATADAATAPRRWRGLVDRLTWLGERTTDAGRDLAHLANMLGAVTMAAAGPVARPCKLRLTATVHLIDRMCWQAVPIMLLITALIGSIIAQQSFFHFRKFGADDYVVDMVDVLVLREIGVLIVAIMVAGRSGGSCTAEVALFRIKPRAEEGSRRARAADGGRDVWWPRHGLVGPIRRRKGAHEAVWAAAREQRSVPAHRPMPRRQQRGRPK